jgi:hypothetical protein
LMDRGNRNGTEAEKEAYVALKNRNERIRCYIKRHCRTVHNQFPLWNTFSSNDSGNNTKSTHHDDVTLNCIVHRVYMAVAEHILFDTHCLPNAVARPEPQDVIALFCRRFGAATYVISIKDIPVSNLFARRKTPIEDRQALCDGAIARVEEDMDSFMSAYNAEQQGLFRNLTYDQARNLANVYFFWPNGSHHCVPYFRRGFAELQAEETTTSQKKREPAAKKVEANTSPTATVEIAPLPPLSKPPSSSSGLAPNSARVVHLNVAKLIVSTNNNDHDGLLGRVMAKTGKAFVMEESVRLAAENYNISFNSANGISFNKYSGVQEWANAVFLWINLGAPKCDVINEFLDEGRRVTWFGGSRMHEKTPAIQRLMHEGAILSSSTTTLSCIVLWCRRYQPTCKTFTPYTCMGRLGYHSHEAGSRPLAFCWNLIDYDRLVKHADLKVRENFAYMLGG